MFSISGLSKYMLNVKKVHKDILADEKVEK